MPVPLEIYFVPCYYAPKLCIGKNIKAWFKKGIREKYVPKIKSPCSCISFTFFLLTLRLSPSVSVFSSTLIYLPCVYILVSPARLLIEHSTMLQTCILLAWKNQFIPLRTYFAPRKYHSLLEDVWLKTNKQNKNLCFFY